MRRENVHFCALSRVAPQDYSIPVPANCLQGQDFCFITKGRNKMFIYSKYWRFDA